MSSHVFPSLPGLAIGLVRTAIAPPVQIRTSPAQREFRARDATVPRYEYTLPFEFLRTVAAYPEFQSLVGFYNKVGGPFDSWLFTDPEDNTATDHTFGTGNGSTTAFQLLRSFGGFAEPIWDLNGSATIKKDGVTQSSGYTVSATGVVTFSTAPASGVALTWSGAFYRRCRFQSDKAEFTRIMDGFYEAKSIKFVSLKP